MSNIPTRQPSARAVEEFQTVEIRTQLLISAENLWERHFTAEERQRLGGNLNRAYCDCGGTAQMWQKLNGGTVVRALLDVAIRINVVSKGDYQWLLRECAEDVNPLDAMSAAINSGSLVLREVPREAYWNSSKIEIPWMKQNKLWNFLFLLAKHAKRGRSVDASTYGAERVNAVTQWKSRLINTNGFPITLADLIHSAERGSQFLKVDAANIRIFVESRHDRLKELH